MRQSARAALVGVVAVAASVGYLAYSSSQSMSALRAKNLAASFPGRQALVVGGTSGIGHGIAQRLAKANFTVTIVGRNAERGREIVEELTKLGGSGHTFLPCDAQLVGNVKTFAAEYAAKHSSLDVLVLTLGYAQMDGRVLTREGLDGQMAVHYYSRMAFIEGLLPLLRAAPAGGGCVLSVLSGGRHAPYPHFASDPSLESHYGLKTASDAAGFYNDLQLDTYSKQADNAKIAFIHAYPGVVSTGIDRGLPWYVRPVVQAMMLFGRSIDDCAEAMCAPLLDTDLAPGFRVLGADASPAAVTVLHTAEARDSIARHTAEVLARVHPVTLPPGAAGTAGSSTTSAGAASAAPPVYA